MIILQCLKIKIVVIIFFGQIALKTQLRRQKASLIPFQEWFEAQLKPVIPVQCILVLVQL